MPFELNRPEYAITTVIVLLIAIFLTIGWVSGWRTLANIYRFSGEFTGKRWRFQSAKMRWMLGYNNCLTIGTSESGLYLSVFFLFRLGHPDLLIPWLDISADRQKGLLSDSIELRFQQIPLIPFRITLALAQRIAEAAGEDWPEGKALWAEAGRKVSHKG